MTKWAAKALGWRIGRTGAAEFAGLFVVGLFMAAIGAFDTDPTNPARANAYWLTVMLAGGVIAALIEPWLWKVPALAKRPPLLAVAQALAMTPPITVMVWLVGAAFSGRVPDPRGLSPRQFISVLIVDVG